MDTDVRFPPDARRRAAAPDARRRAAAPASPRRAVQTTRRTPRPARPLPGDVAGELVKAGGPHRSASLQRQLADAVRAFEAERYADALRAVKPVVSAAPAAGSVRELHGLILYRLGRWRAALDELAVAHRLTQSFDQHPVMADCQRALGRHAKVEALWNELRRASPTADVLAEGRMVLAGSLADRGKVSDAIAVLDPFGADRARPKPWQLRTWYALADLYERGGDVPHARELFRRLVRHDAGFHDVVERLAAL